MGKFWDTLAGFANPIASLVGGVVNGVSDIISTNSTNEANKDINEAQLAAQREYWKQQQQNWLQERRWSLEDRSFENAYNSPAALKSRYLAAGINPYLAMQGQSSPASVQAVSPSAPNAPNVPSSIPMQKPDLSGFGLGISQMVSTVLQQAANEREDYRLANDIEVSRINANANFLDAMTKAKEAGVNEKFINHQIEDANNRYFLELDKWFVDKENRDATLKIENKRLDLEEKSLDIQKILAASNIAVNRAQAAQLYKAADYLVTQKNELLANGKSQREAQKIINSKEKEVLDMLKRENAIDAEVKEESGEWNIIWSSILEPFKGVLSLGASVSSKVK